MEESAEEKVIAAKGKLPPYPVHPPENGTWNYLKVPGRWDARGAFYMYDASRNKVGKIAGRTRSAYSQGWIRRSFSVPESWKGKDVILEFSGVSRSARLFINGVQVTVFIMNAHVPVSPWLIYGKENDLSLFVSLKSLPLAPEHPRHREYTGFRRGDGADWWFNWNPGPGISGDVFVNVLPQNIRLDDLHIATTTSDRKLTASAELCNKTGETRSFSLKGVVSDGNKTLFRLPASTVSLRPGENRRVVVTGIWENAVFWSPENPKLFRLHLTLHDSSGKPLDELSSRFGFREMKIRGSDFVLNGKKIHLKFLSSQFQFDGKSMEDIRNILLALKRLHFNGILYESLDSRTLELCDELGMLAAIRHVMPPLVRNGEYLPGVPNQGIPFAAYLSNRYAGARKDLEEAISGIVRKFRNHPSVVIWMLNPLLCWNPNWINPNTIDAEPRQSDVMLASLREEAFLRRLDPTRIVIQSMGANTGAVISCNPYPTFSNQPDEWADWPMRWAERRKKPLLLEEVALPFVFNFASFHSSSKNRFNGWTDMRQLFYEHAARYFGDPIYTSAKPEMSDVNWHSLSNGNREKNTDLSSYAPLNPAAEAAHVYWLRRCGLAWRLYDIPGVWPFQGHQLYYSHGSARKRDFSYVDVTAPGIKYDFGTPESFTETNRVFDEQKRIQSPFLAWIAGRPERFSSQEHNYYSGQELVKQFIFSNHSLSPAPVAANYRISDRKRVLFSASWKGVVAEGENIRLPFHWTIPEVTERTDLSLELVAQSGKNVCRDVFAVTAFPRKQPFPQQMEILLYDESGKTAALLRKMGIRHRIADGSEKETAVLMIGCNSFTERFLKMFPDLKQRLDRGLTLLVMNQNRDTLLKEYLEERRARHVFLKDSQHPVLRNIRPADLLHWRGESDTAEAYPETLSAVHHNRFIHWGQEGTVSTFVMDKPYSGRFRILLDCDADLSRTPLIEYFSGKGRMILCQLDLDSRYGSDPIATQLAERLVAYAAAPEKMPPKKAVFSGSPKMRKELEQLGFRFSELPWNRAEVLVSADSDLPPDDLRAFTERGGTVLLFGASDAQYSACGLSVPSMMKCRLAAFDRSPLLRGVGNSDFYFNPALKLPLFPDHRAFRSIKSGKGTIAAFTLSPEMFQEYASRIKVKRILSTLLTNSGVEGADELALTPQTAAGELTEQPAAFAVDPEEQGIRKKYHLPETDDSKWRTIKLGLNWEAQGIVMENPKYRKSAMPYDGDAWYRIRVFIPESWRDKQLVFHADSIDDLDWVWFNGSLIGHTGETQPNYWEISRNYKVPQNKVLFGKENLIAVRVRDLRGNGGILNSVRLTPEGTVHTSVDLLWKRPKRDIRDFDPNFWRQW